MENLTKYMYIILHRFLERSVPKTKIEIYNLFEKVTPEPS